MKPQEIRDMNQRELRNRLEASREELLNLRFGVETRKLKNASRIGELKRDIARMHSILRERELMEQYGVATFDESEEAATQTQQTPRRRGLFGLGRGR